MNHLYEISTGELKSSTILSIDPIPAGMAVKVSRNTGAWNTSTLDFDAVVEARYIALSAFYKRITCATRLEIKTAAVSDLAIENLLEYISGFELIDLDDEELIGGLDYLVAGSVITAEKKAEVLA